MKKILAVIVCLLMLFALASCRKNVDSDDNSTIPRVPTTITPAIVPTTTEHYTDRDDTSHSNGINEDHDIDDTTKQ